jgi:hypothetical protein
MRIDWLYLALALLLLLPPIPFSAAFQKTLQSFRRNSLANALAAARVWQNWIDFGRAALGVFFLTQLAVRADPVHPDPQFEYKSLALEAGILGIVLLAQTVRWFRTVQFLAPLFYVCGLTLIFSSLPLHRGLDIGFRDVTWQGAFAVVVAWFFAIGGKNLTYLLPAMAAALAAAGYVLGLGLPLMINCALILVPPILALLFKKKLIFVARIPSAS